MVDADYFIAKAEELFRLSLRTNIDPELARALDALAHEFMAKAVELDSSRDKAAARPPRRRRG